MTAYYNEIDPYAAQWLRNLIKAGHIAPGVVDERSIEDVLPNDLQGFAQCHFFAGIGVWSYALRRAGWSDDRPVWTGSCPCQPFSAAGKGAGLDDERHLWPHFHHLIKERKPPAIYGEQVAGSNAGPWLDLVQADMEGLAYAFGAVAFTSAGVGSEHIRSRTFWLADAVCDGHATTQERCQIGASQNPGWMRESEGRFTQTILGRDGKTRPCEPGFAPWVDESPQVLGRLRAYGNAINAEAARVFIQATMN